MQFSASMIGAGRCLRRLANIDRPTAMSLSKSSCSARFQVGNNDPTLLCVCQSNRHCRSPHGFARVGKKALKRLLVPHQIGRTQSSGVARSFDATRRLAEYAREARPDAVLSRLHAMAASAALLEQPLSIGSLLGSPR